MMEDVEQRLVRILFVLGCIFLLLLGLAFWGIPFPLLVPAFLVVAPISAFVIWRHKDKIEEI
jgi:glycerol-3-phosphate acyltransferase PlsY